MEGIMRRRRGRRWLWPVMFWTCLIGRSGPTQTASLPPALDPRQTPSPPSGGATLPDSGDQMAYPMPPAPQPIPGPAGAGLPVGGMDARTPQGLPINLPTALQLAGARPLDIATATAQLEQALALQLQARALWIPNLNAGVTYYRHDGVQQNFLKGPIFRK